MVGEILGFPSQGRVLVSRPEGYFPNASRRKCQTHVEGVLPPTASLEDNPGQCHGSHYNIQDERMAHGPQ